jgi:hypothetical protein
VSNLDVQFRTPFNPCADGLTVEAWLASNFLHAPVSTDAYPPGGSPVSSGTTSGGACTLTGLSGVAYYVSIIDESNKPNFFYVPASYIGATTYTARYTPDPVTAAPVAAAQIGGRIYRATNQTGLSSPTPFLPTATDYLDGVTTGSDPSSGAAGLQVVTVGLYVVSINVLLMVSSGGGATPGNCQLLVSGGSNDISVSTYSDGVYDSGGTTLQFTDIWSLGAGARVFARVDTPDDSAYEITGARKADFGLSSLAIAYAGGTLS